jgi:hypothetical protein
MAAKDRHHRHDSHPDEESAYPSRFFGDGNRDDGVTVIRALGEGPSPEEPVGTGSVTTVTVMTMKCGRFLSGVLVA